MAGVKGAGGPPPKRSDQRRRTNTPASGEPRQAPTEEPTVPEPDEDWHPIARMWFDSLGHSGQSAFYASSDWALAYRTAEAISREFKPQPVVSSDGEVQWVKFPPKAAALMAWAKADTMLLVAEGDRRRIGLELQRPKAEEAEPDVSWLSDARDRLRGAG